PFTNLALAYGINESGQVSGGGYTTNGSYHAFLATPSRLILVAPTMLPGQQFQATVQGVPGQRFVILSSGHLVGWSTLITNVLVTGTTNFTDPSATLNAVRFYRGQTIP